MFHTFHTHRPKRALIVLLAFALWMAGVLGVMHEAVHVPGLTAAVASIDTASHDDHGHVHAGRHGIAGLFGAHTDAECRLYDQLAHGASAPTVPAVVLPVLLPSATFAYLQGEFIARWIALFDARGPPSAR